MTPDRPVPAPGDPARALRDLRERYRASAPALAAPLRALAATLLSDPQSRTAITAVRQHAHRLRGTAGSYGFQDASDLAAALEARAAQWEADPAVELDRRSSAVSAFADA